MAATEKPRPVPGNEEPGTVAVPNEEEEHATESESKPLSPGPQPAAEDLESPAVDTPEPPTESSPSPTESQPPEADAEVDFEAMLLASVDEQLHPPEPGQIIEGRVIHIGESFVVLDIGYRVEGVIPVEEVMDEDGKVTVQENDTIEAVVLRYNGDAEYIPLSRRQAEFRAAWNRVEAAFREQQPVEGTIVRRLRGGYFVDLGGVRGFLPGSQVDIQRVHDYESWLGKTIQVRVLNMDPHKRTIIVSRRVLLEEELERQRAALLERLHPGAVLEGTVKNITDYGVFVDLGGVDGMIHKSDLSWQRVPHPSEVVEVGQKLRVKVLAFDPETRRISLGLKQLQPEPWTQAMKKYKPGDTVQATVTNVVDYGAFVELEPGISGLIHLSELSWSPRIRHPRQVVKIGDTVEVRILDIDHRRKRISLSLRQVQENPVDRFLEEHPPGSVVEAVVDRFNMRGAICILPDGPDVLGFIPVREINWSRKVLPPSEYLKKGQKVQAKVLRARRDLVRVYLSVRQTMENPWEKFAEKYRIGDMVRGRVVEKFERGCFVRLEEHPDLEALLPRGHYLRRRSRARRVVQEPEIDQELELKIIQMEPARRRIVVSLRELMREKAKKEIEEAREKAKRSEKVRLGDIISQEIEKLKKIAKSNQSSSGEEEAESN